MTAAMFLAYDPNKVKPGWIAFWLVVALCVATFLLWRSMNTQLRKIRMPPKQGRPPGPPGTRTPASPPVVDPVDPSKADDDRAD
jgi:hypothetical protein